MTMTSKGIWRLFPAILGVLLFAATLRGFGQDINASLSGTVSDPSGAAIPGAKLTLTNEATGFQSIFVSDAAGEYTFRNLTPGKYDLSASAPGFKSADQKGIELAINQTARQDVHLPVGQTGETVTVVADASLINYENQTLEGGVSPEALQDFPLVVSGAPRSSVAVATMMPGVTSAGGNNAFNARINGGIITGDEAIVDGVTTSEGFMNQSGMVALQTDFGMSPDITSEVKILTANYDAQYGNTTSGQLIIQTKSGGEHFHGGGYEYIRNDLFNSAQYGSTKGADKENDFGAYIGGPWYVPGFHGDKSFFKGYFYFNWEGFQDHGGAVKAVDSIASTAARNGDFSGWGSQLFYPNDAAKFGPLAGTAIPNNQIDPKFEDPIAKAWMGALPTPTNSSELSNYVIPRSGQASLTNSENVYFARADMNIGQKDHLYYTYWWQYAGVNTNTDLPIALSNAGPANPENAPIQRFNWEHTLNNSMTNHFSFGYLNRNEGYYQLDGGSSLPKVPGVASTKDMPDHAVSELHPAWHYPPGQLLRRCDHARHLRPHRRLHIRAWQAHFQGWLRMEKGRHQHPQRHQSWRILLIQRRHHRHNRCGTVPDGLPRRRHGLLLPWRRGSGTDDLLQRAGRVSSPVRLRCALWRLVARNHQADRQPELALGLHYPVRREIQQAVVL